MEWILNITFKKAQERLKVTALFGLNDNYTDTAYGKMRVKKDLLSAKHIVRHLEPSALNTIFFGGL